MAELTPPYSIEYKTRKSEYNLPDFADVALYTEFLTKVSFSYSRYEQFNIWISTPLVKQCAWPRDRQWIGIYIALKNIQNAQVNKKNAYMHIKISIGTFQSHICLKMEDLRQNMYYNKKLFHYTTVCQSFKTNQYMIKSSLRVQLKCVVPRKQYNKLNGNIPRANPYVQPCKY
ncbi:MAG: hypothetical protein GY928_07850, partial [Colwellia sp.]|nr:hypothetical protein [Colwellia sp.]